MALRPIHLLGSPALRERAIEVGPDPIDDEIRTLVKDLFDTMYAAKGIGLAANQVGVIRRVAVVETENDPPIVLIDPEIVEREGKERAEEGCLSVPDIFGEVDRAKRVVVETTTLEGKRERVEASDLSARAVQHEIDHLDGVLFLDRLSLLKRRMLIKKWQKLRKGKPDLTIDVTPAPAR